MPKLSLSLVLLVALLVEPPLGAQTNGGGFEEVYRWDGTFKLQRLGHSSSAGDMNGDGYDDILVTNKGNLNLGGGVFRTTVSAYSGRDGSILHHWSTLSALSASWLTPSKAGDINGDGFSDVMIGYGRADFQGTDRIGSVLVFSGDTGAILLRLNGSQTNSNFGYTLSPLGDVNSDGFDDIAVYAGTRSGGLINAGSVHLYSGIDGSLLWQRDGNENEDFFGISLADAGDLNADGIHDLLVGAPRTPGDSAFGPYDKGSVLVLSGVDGSTLMQIDGQQSFSYLGDHVSSAGDFDADGIPDLLISGSGASLGSGFENHGAVFVFSGATGSILFQSFGRFSGDHHGEALAGVGDFNGDGLDDFLISTGHRNVESQWTATVGLYSGGNGQLLQEWIGQARKDAFGDFIAAAGDVNADGRGDVLIGASFRDIGGIENRGSVYVYAFHPLMEASSPTVSAGTGGSINLELDFPEQAAIQEYQVLLSTTGIGPTRYGIDIPLTKDDRFLNSAVGIFPFTTTAGMMGTLDSTGDASASFSIAPGALQGVVGRSFWLAAVSFPIGETPRFSSVAVPIEIIP